MRSRAARHAELHTHCVLVAEGAGVNVLRHSLHRRRHMAAQACRRPPSALGGQLDHDPAAKSADNGQRVWITKALTPGSVLGRC